MIIVGNASVLAKDRFWSSLLFHFKENGCLFEGMNWKQLSPSTLVFNNPELDFSERARFVQDVEESINSMNQGVIGPNPGYANQQLISQFSNKHRNSTLGFEMLPEQRSKTRHKQQLSWTQLSSEASVWLRDCRSTCPAGTSWTGCSMK